jgi:hypothetical protein
MEPTSVALIDVFLVDIFSRKEHTNHDLRIEVSSVGGNHTALICLLQYLLLYLLSKDSKKNKSVDRNCVSTLSFLNY